MRVTTDNDKSRKLRIYCVSTKLVFHKKVESKNEPFLSTGSSPSLSHRDSVQLTASVSVVVLIDLLNLRLSNLILRY